MINYVFINQMGSICTNLNGKNSLFCLPKKVQCPTTDTDGFLTLCDQAYCKIKCDYEHSSIVPFKRGDIIHIQTQFRDKVNTDIYNPTSGWGEWMMIELINTSTGEVVSTNISQIVSKWYVCHNGSNSYQVIEIDTNKEVSGDFIIPDCWQLKVYSLDAIGGEANIVEERCTNQFTLVDDCWENHTIEGEYSDFDCVGNFYGTPDCGAGEAGGAFFKYSNKTRLQGVINKQSTEIETEDDVQFTVENYELKMYSTMSYYLIGWYINLFTPKNKLVKIDGNESEIINFAVSYTQKLDHSAFVIFTWQVKCKIC